MDNRTSLVLKIVLSLSVIFLSYFLYEIIQEPIRYEKIKDERYEQIQVRLEQIRDAQKAYRGEYRQFAKDFNALIAFVDTGKQTIVERKDSSFMYYNEVYQQEMEKDTIVTKILGHQSVKDNLFGADFNASDLQYIPFTDNDKFEMAADQLEVNDVIVPVFEAKASNKVIFADVLKKYEKFIDRSYSLAIGSLTEPTLSGNWK